MLFRRTYGVAIMVGLILGALVTIQAASILDVPGAEVVRPPERGTGTKCAEGDEGACRRLCEALSDVSTLVCVDHLARVFPAVHETVGGGGGSSGTSPPSPNGGEPSSGSTRPQHEPPPGPQGPPGNPGPPGRDSPVPDVPRVPPRICAENPLLPVCLDLP